MYIDDSDIELTYINSEKEFHGLAKDWNRLAELSDAHSVFLRHEWFEASWQWLKFECELSIVCVKRDNIIIGIIPMVLRTVKRFGIKLNKLEFMSIPDTQLCEVISARKDYAKIIHVFVLWLKSKEKNWDFLEFGKLAEDSEIHDALTLVTSQYAFNIDRKQDGVNSGVSLADTWEEYYARRSRRLKKGNNHVLNKLKRSGKSFEIKYLNAASADNKDVEATLKSAIELSSLSWKSKTGLTLENPGPLSFINTITDYAYKNGWLSIWTLLIDDVPAAMEYQLDYDGIIYALRADYNPEYEELSPGTYLNWKILDSLFHNESVYYSMGPGSNEYKARWTEELPVLYKIVVYNKNFYGFFLYYWDQKLLPLVRRSYKRFKRLVGKE